VAIVHLKERPAECPDCRQRFSSNSAVRNHRRVAHAGQRHECPDCALAFNTMAGLGNHAWTVHEKVLKNVKIYECPECKRTFTVRQRFEEHLILHKGLKPHKYAILTLNYPW
jgi:KRAB domain-containing zinc finger protein